MFPNLLNDLAAGVTIVGAFTVAGNWLDRIRPRLSKRELDPLRIVNEFSRINIYGAWFITSLCIASIVLSVAIFLYQFSTSDGSVIYYDSANFSFRAVDDNSIYYFGFIIIAIFNVGVDYISAVQTIFLSSVVRERKTIASLIFFSVSDLILSVYLFIFLTPISLVLVYTTVAAMSPSNYEATILRVNQVKIDRIGTSQFYSYILSREIGRDTMMIFESHLQIRLEDLVNKLNEVGVDIKILNHAPALKSELIEEAVNVSVTAKAPINFIDQFSVIFNTLSNIQKSFASTIFRSEESYVDVAGFADAILVGEKGEAICIDTACTAKASVLVKSFGIPSVQFDRWIVPISNFFLTSLIMTAFFYVIMITYILGSYLSFLFAEALARRGLAGQTYMIGGTAIGVLTSLAVFMLASDPSP